MACSVDGGVSALTVGPAWVSIPEKPENNKRNIAAADFAETAFTPSQGDAISSQNPVFPQPEVSSAMRRCVSYLGIEFTSQRGLFRIIVLWWVQMLVAFAVGALTFMDIGDVVVRVPLCLGGFVLLLACAWRLGYAAVLDLHRDLSMMVQKLDHITTPRSKRQVRAGDSKVAFTFRSALEVALLRADKVISDQRKIIIDHPDFLRYVFHQIRVPLNALTGILDLVSDQVQSEASHCRQSSAWDQVTDDLMLAQDQVAMVAYALNEASDLRTTLPIKCLELDTFKVASLAQLVTSSFTEDVVSKNNVVTVAPTGMTLHDVVGDPLQRLGEILLPNLTHSHTRVREEFIQADRSQLYQAVQALVCNACQAASPHTTIQVTWSFAHFRPDTSFAYTSVGLGSSAWNAIRHKVIGSIEVSICVSNIGTQPLRLDLLPLLMRHPKERLCLAFRSGISRRGVGLHKANLVMQAHGGSVRGHVDQLASASSLDPSPIRAYKTTVELCFRAPVEVVHVTRAEARTSKPDELSQSQTLSRFISTPSPQIRGSVTSLISTSSVGAGAGGASRSTRQPVSNLQSALSRAVPNLHTIVPIAQPPPSPSPADTLSVSPADSPLHSPSAVPFSFVVAPSTTTTTTAITTHITAAAANAHVHAAAAAAAAAATAAQIQTPTFRDPYRRLVPLSAQEIERLSPKSIGRSINMRRSTWLPPTLLESGGGREFVNHPSVGSVPFAPDNRPVDRRLILVAEDEAITRKIYQRMLYLPKFGCHTILAIHGEDALAQYKASEALPLLILMDGTMPVMDGVTATLRLRALGCRRPIVAITGNSTQADVDAFLQAGANEVLAKPVNQAMLDAVLLRYRNH